MYPAHAMNFDLNFFTHIPVKIKQVKSFLLLNLCPLPNTINLSADNM